MKKITDWQGQNRGVFGQSVWNNINLSAIISILQSSINEDYSFEVYRREMSNPSRVLLHKSTCTLFFRVVK